MPRCVRTRTASRGRRKWMSEAAPTRSPQISAYKAGFTIPGKRNTVKEDFIQIWNPVARSTATRLDLQAAFRSPAASPGMPGHWPEQPRTRHDSRRAAQRAPGGSSQRPPRNATIAAVSAAASRLWNRVVVSRRASVALRMLPHSIRIFGSLARFRPARSSRKMTPWSP